MKEVVEMKKFVYADNAATTHHCNARWIKRKYDPTFIDEIEEYDAMFGK